MTVASITRRLLLVMAAASLSTPARTIAAQPPRRVTTRATDSAAIAARTRLPSRVLTTPVVSGGVVQQGARAVSQPTARALLGASTLAELKVVRAAGVETVAPHETTVVVKPGEFVFRKVAAAPTLVTKHEPTPTRTDTVMRQWTLPYRWFTVDSSGNSHLLIPVLRLQGGGLSFDRAASGFTADAYVGLEDSLASASGSRHLPRPLRMLLTLTRPGAVSPDTLAVDHTGLQYASVRVKTSASDSVSLHVQTATDPQGVDIPLRVFRPQVRLLVQPPIIAALGLATAGLSVVLPPGTGAETVTVRLAAEEGLVSPKTLGATVDGENAATIRSTRPGRFHVTAFVDGIPADTQSIAFVWPLSFAVATLCGVVLSGLGKFVGAKKPTPRRFLLDVLRGLPFGIIAAAAGAIGVDLVGLKLTDAVAATSVAVMLTAAFGAWGGRRIMKV